MRYPSLRVHSRVTTAAVSKRFPQDERESKHCVGEVPVPCAVSCKRSYARVCCVRTPGLQPSTAVHILPLNHIQRFVMFSAK